MARNGSGTYSNPYPNFISGTVISSSQVDSNNSDIATALTQSIAVDGQSVVTGDIPLATHKFTAMKVGTAATDSLSLGQAQAEAFVWCGTAGGSADAITLSPSPAITAYAAGQRFVWMASGNTNTGATTVAISGLGTIALQDNGAALTAGQHAASKMFMGILNTTSTVQIMQVQVSGTDPLIISSLTVTGDATIGDDLTLLSDASVLGFGEHTDVKITHVADSGLTLKNTSTGDDTPFVLLIQTGETDIALNDALGKIQFQAPDEGTGTDSRLVAAEIAAVSEGDFSASNNATKLSFKTGASEAATEKMSLSSAGDLTVTNDVILDSDAAVIKLGDNQDVTITHNHDTGITLNSKDIGGVNSINGGQIGGSRNYLYNGDTSLCQRATSVASIGNGDSGYHVQDRWKITEQGTTGGEVTMSQATEVPNGFQYSMKIDCTTAEVLAADESWWLEQRLEGQDLYAWKKGTADALPVTLGFWVNATKTGVNIVSLYDADNNRHISQSYTVNSSNTWEYKQISFSGDTTGVFGRDNNVSLQLIFWLVAGSNFMSGTLATSWASYTAANAAVGQINNLDSTSNNFHITGTQLELGEQASIFQNETYAENFIRCARYYEKIAKSASYSHPGNSYSTTATVGHTVEFKVTKRTAPTIAVSGLGTSSGQIGVTNATGNYVSGQPSSIAANLTVDHAGIYFTSGISGLTDDSISTLFGNGSSFFYFDAEL